jgi:hypothetical protein
MLDSISSFLLLYKIYFLYKNWGRKILETCRMRKLDGGEQVFARHGNIQDRGG